MLRKKLFFMALLLVPVTAIAIANVKTDVFQKFKMVQSFQEVLAGVVPGEGNKIDLETVQEKIKEKGAKWEAGETSISKLSNEEKANMVAGGDLISSFPDVPRVDPPVKVKATKLDWRNNGGNYVTPIKNQGNCGSCWAFATTATAESSALIKNSTTYTENPIDLSEQVMLSCSGAGNCNGGSDGEASLFLQNTGLPNESCYGYTGTDGSCDAACANWQDATNKIGGYIGIPNDVPSLKNALASYGPIVTIFKVYNDFYYYKRGVYSYTTGDYIGFHAVSIIGYDDASKSFLVKNSWGTDWGENGYFRIAYSELSSVVQFASGNLAYNVLAPDDVAPTASILSPFEGTTVSGSISVSMAADDNIGVMKAELYANGKLVGADSNSPFNFVWNTNSVPNGNATLMAYAYDARENIGVSLPVIVAVDNAPDTLVPDVFITSPADGASINGTAIISASASDNAIVASMEIYIDGIKVASSYADSISYSWNTKKAAQGAHVIKVSAKDGAGNIGTKSINVYVTRR